MNFNSFAVLGVTMLLGAGAYLCMYLINKLNSDISDNINQGEIDVNKRYIYIIRRLPSLNLDEKIKEYIKKIKSSGKYRILTTDTYQNSRIAIKQSMLYSLVYKRFLQKLFKKDDNIVIMNRNLFHWEYDNYYLLAKSLNIPVKIIEFTTDAKISQDNIHLYSQLNLEQKLFESDPRTDEIVKL
jgi:hypothetical protein